MLVGLCPNPLCSASCPMQAARSCGTLLSCVNAHSLRKSAALFGASVNGAAHPFVIKWACCVPDTWKRKGRMQKWNSSFWCLVKNAAQNFGMRTECQGFGIPIVLCMASCSTALADPSTKPSGFVKIGSWRKTAATATNKKDLPEPTVNGRGSGRSCVYRVCSFSLWFFSSSKKSSMFFCARSSSYISSRALRYSG